VAEAYPCAVRALDDEPRFSVLADADTERWGVVVEVDSLRERADGHVREVRTHFDTF